MQISMKRRRRDKQTGRLLETWTKALREDLINLEKTDGFRKECIAWRAEIHVAGPIISTASYHDDGLALPITMPTPQKNKQKNQKRKKHPNQNKKNEKKGVGDTLKETRT